MAKLLYVKASPRGERSRSVAAADAFVASWRTAHRDGQVETVDVFGLDLPAFDGAALEAKYEILHGKSPTADHRQAWSRVETVIEQFKAADAYAFAVPMWNFGIPYRLKQYLDVLIQPGYTFAYDPDKGYSGLVTGRKAFVAYARGGDYGPEGDGVDHQKSYFELALGFIGISHVESVIVQPTLAGGPDVAKRRLDEAIAQAREKARSF